MAQAAVAAWSGIANGRIPTAMMLSIGSGQVMEPHAARQLLAALADMSAHGFSVPVVEGYRDYATQVQLRNLYLAGKGNVAAVPGTSNHGTGSAVDLGGGMDSWSSSAQAYWGSIESKYGYSSAQGRADGEPWHKVCVQWLDNINNIFDGGFLMALSDAEQSEVLNSVRQLNKLIQVPGQAYGFPEANSNKLDAIAGRLEARKPDGTDYGFDYLPAILNNINGLFALVQAKAPTAGGAITADQVQQIADSLKQGLGAEVATELSKRLAS